MQTKTLLREQARANVRQAILDAARLLFHDEGYAGLSMRRLASSIGYTPKTIYLHFSDKDDLLSELIEEDVGRLADALEAAAASQTDPGRRLDAVAFAYMTFAQENPYAYEAIFMIRHHPLSREAAQHKQHVQGKRMLDIFARVVDESGRVAPGLDPQFVVHSLRTALHGVAAFVALGRNTPRGGWKKVVNHLVAGAVGEGRS